MPYIQHSKIHTFLFLGEKLFLWSLLGSPKLEYLSIFDFQSTWKFLGGLLPLIKYIYFNSIHTLVINFTYPGMLIRTQLFGCSKFFENH